MKINTVVNYGMWLHIKFFGIHMKFDYILSL